MSLAYKKPLFDKMFLITTEDKHLLDTCKEGATNSKCKTNGATIIPPPPVEDENEDSQLWYQDARERLNRLTDGMLGQPSSSKCKSLSQKLKKCEDELAHCKILHWQSLQKTPDTNKVCNKQHQYVSSP